MIIDNNFGNLCMKKGGSFQKERFSFFSVVNGGEFLTPETPLPSAYATDSRRLEPRDKFRAQTFYAIIDKLSTGLH